MIEDEALPTWIRYVQAEGQPYFVNVTKESGITYVTEADLSDKKERDEVNDFVNMFERKWETFRQRFARKHNFSRSSFKSPAISPSTGSGSHREDEDPLPIKELPKNIEVALQISKNSWEYYCVDLDLRLIFWLDKTVLGEEPLPPYFGIQFSEQLRSSFQSQFWTHVEFFPCHRPVVEGVLDELMGILLHMHVDLSTSRTSTSLFDKSELDSLIEDVKRMAGMLVASLHTLEESFMKICCFQNSMTRTPTRHTRTSLVPPHA